MMTLADTYRPEGMKTVKRVYNRAMRYQLDPTGQPLHVFEASSRTLQTLAPQELALPTEFERRLEELINNLKRGRWQDDPETGNETIKLFYGELNREMRRLGLRVKR
jgi:hypothetical protein